MSKTVLLVCEICQKEFNKQKNEYNRRIKLGYTKFYCSLSCKGKDPKNIKHILDNHSNYEIWKLPNYSKKDNYSRFRPLLKNAKQRHKKEFNLTLEHLNEIWQQQNGICPFTGFKLELRAYTDRDRLSIKSASLDRIDNSKGYVIGNVRFVSVMFNLARNKFSDKEVIEFAHAIVANDMGV